MNEPDDQRYLPVDPSQLDVDLQLHLRALAETQHETPLEMWSELRTRYLRKLHLHNHKIEQAGITP